MFVFQNAVLGLGELCHVNLYLQICFFLTIKYGYFLFLHEYHNICFHEEIRKTVFLIALLSGAMFKRVILYNFYTLG